MRALLLIRPDHEGQAGGDTTHALRTADELRALGVEADVTGGLGEDLSAYDLVHLFNTSTIEPSFRHALRARAAGAPIVLTPIFWRPPLENLAFAEVDRANFRERNAVMRDVVLGLADALLPNSEAELVRIRETFAHVPRTVRIAHVGVDESWAGGDGERFSRRHELPFRGFVLCAARLEELKNQLRLVEACAPLGVPLVLAGAEYEDRLEYARACRARAGELGADVRFLPQVSPDELRDAYAAAKVHALPSVWETVGLASLEAAVAGCAVVSTSRCGVPEYLGDLARYCDPESVESIRDAVARSLSEPLDGRLAAHVAGRFTWRESARVTLEAYERVLSERGEGAGEDWRATFTPEQYVEHLESLIQLQLETIALRDGYYANAREQAERAVEYAKSLEVERERLERELARARRPRGRLSEILRR